MEGDIHSNIADFVRVWNISNIVCHKKSLKFKLFFISKFKFDRVHGKILKGTLMQIENLPISSSSYENNMLKISH